MADLAALAHEEYAYLTTRGRSTGRPHTIEIWFAVHDGALFLLAGGHDRSDWVQNLRSEPGADLRIDDTELRVIGDEPAPDDPAQPVARTALREKYAYEGDDLRGWAQDSLLVRLTPAG
jgi:hypothetical protein